MRMLNGTVWSFVGVCVCVFGGFYGAFLGVDFFPLPFPLRSPCCRCFAGRLSGCTMGGDNFCRCWWCAFGMTQCFSFSHCLQSPKEWFFFKRSDNDNALKVKAFFFLVCMIVVISGVNI